MKFLRFVLIVEKMFILKIYEDARHETREG